MTEDGERTIASVLQSIVGNIEQIVRSEIRLAKAEVREEAGKAGQASKLLAIGAVLGIYAFGILLLCCVYLLATVVAPWLAALIVAVCLGAIAGGLIVSGWKQIKQVNPTPNKTVASLKENVEWAKTQTK